jgi:hypothetical protein
MYVYIYMNIYRLVAKHHGTSIVTINIQFATGIRQFFLLRSGIDKPDEFIMYIYINICVHICIYIFAYIYVYIYSYIYVQRLESGG